MSPPGDVDVAAATRQSLFADLPEPLVTRVLAAAPFVSVPGVHNVRDVALCGADIQAPPVARPGHIFRSATLHHITPEGAKELARLGIVKVFDLRSERERESLVTPPLEGIENIWLPPARERTKFDPASFTGSREDVHSAFANLYEDVLSTHTPIFRRVFEHIKDAPDDQHLLFHCQAGKDRTGVLAALILDLTGVKHDTIAHDYALTRIGLEPARFTLLDPASESSGPADPPAPAEPTNSSSAKLTLDPRSADFVTGLKQAIQHGAPQAPMDYFVEGMFRSDEPSMAMFLARLQSHGGAKGYLHTQLGFTPEEVEQIRARLLP